MHSILKFNPALIDNLTNFTSASWVMNSLSAGTEDIISSSNMPVFSSTSAVSTYSYPNQTLTYRNSKLIINMLLNFTDSQHRKIKYCFLITHLVI